MKRYLLDTNHLGQALRPVSPVRERILQTLRSGARFGTVFLSFANWKPVC
jgi:hypothetical protein